MRERMRFQQTIRKPVTCSGVGLHTGCRVSVTLKPAPQDTGIVFIRTDVGGNPRVPVSIKHARPALLSTTVGVDGVQIQTIEHLLAAAAGLGIDNLYVDVDAPELPALDGSATPFVSLLLEAGIAPQDRRQAYLKVVRPLEVVDGDKRITIRPAAESRVTYTIDYAHPMIGRQVYAYDCSRDAFVGDIAPARTFGFLREVEALWEAGLGLGGSLQNTLILSEEGLLNEGGLRFDDEFVRHKILDLIGDMMLLGLPVIGEIEAVRSGHALHARLVSRILESRDNWVLISAQAPVPAGRLRELPPSLVASPSRD
ncbi:MAG: UDP-3-O-acyl-N-acetylglucosamine deacetylase [Nitrospirae bacterium]|nr:MAG: UDP-3-O-acyl-N-acetylglucosamine deacetylase [Nitrospirota bacterium]